jgi:putative component of toxin-antitoxin plasmid stabilization module
MVQQDQGQIQETKISASLDRVENGSCGDKSSQQRDIATAHTLPEIFI